MGLDTTVKFNESDVLRFGGYYMKYTVFNTGSGYFKQVQLIFDTDKGKYLLAGSELLLPEDSKLLRYCHRGLKFVAEQGKELCRAFLLCDLLISDEDLANLDDLKYTHYMVHKSSSSIVFDIVNTSFLRNRFYLKDDEFYYQKGGIADVEDMREYLKFYYAYACSVLESFCIKGKIFDERHSRSVSFFIKNIFGIDLKFEPDELLFIFPVQYLEDEPAFKKIDESTESKKLTQLAQTSKTSEQTQTSKTTEQSQICKKLDILAKGVEKVGTSLDTLLADDRLTHIKADDITLSNEGFKITNESLKLDDVKISNDIKLATDTSTVLRQTYSLENVADTSMLSIGDYTDKLSKDFLNETATSLHETRNFLLNYRLFGNAVSHSNIVAVKGSTGSGKTTLVKAWALGYNAIERHTSAIRHAKYYNEINIDTCVGDEDIFVAKQITNLSTVSCDTSVLGIMRALEADYVECKEEGKEFKDRAVIVISDARCVDFDRVFSKIKGLACYEDSDFIVNKEVFHIMGNITWVVIYNDKGKGSMELSLPMARRAMFVNIDMIEASYDDVKNNFTDDAIDLFDVDRYSLESFVEALNNINAKIRDNEYSTVGYIPYNMLLYPKEKYGTAIDVYNLLAYYKNLYSIVLSESGGTIKDDFLSCLFDDVMRSVIDEF